MRCLLIVGALLMACEPAWAAGTIAYGSRGGMDVTVTSMSGLDTANAVIRTKHTRENALTFCRGYNGKATAHCIHDELATRLNDQVTANCTTGNFKDFYGDAHRFEGQSRESGAFQPKFVLIDNSTGQKEGATEASGYYTNMGIFKALCPSKVPGDF